MPASDYPHKCPSCGARAYVGFKAVDCSDNGCKHWDGKQAPPVSLADLASSGYVRQYLAGTGLAWVPPGGFNTTTHPAVQTPAVGDVYTRANSPLDWTLTSIDPQYVTLQSGGMMITLPVKDLVAPQWIFKHSRVSVGFTGAGQIAAGSP